MVKNDLQGITAYLQQLNQQREIPPLAEWHPQYCGEMDLLIKANGEWWHQGQQIQRQALIDLFAKILCREGDDYYLKTPVEKLKIQVEDVPLLITQVDQIMLDGLYYLQFTTQNQDVFIADETHQIFMREYLGESRPYVQVRAGLDALIQRQAFYHLVNYGELSQQQATTLLKLNSGTTQFTLSMV